MMNFFMVLSFSISFMFLFMSHPLSLGFMLLMQTIMVSLMTGMVSYTYWYSYILFLVMIGGMLVLFIYMTSIASNEKFLFSNKLALFFFLMITFLIIILLTNDSFMSNNFIKNNEMSYMFYNYNNSLSLMKYMNYPSNMILFMIYMYLFITLIAVTKICDKSQGSLRQKF